MIDEGSYFTINRGRQYGKTTTLYMLNRNLRNDYFILDSYNKRGEEQLFGYLIISMKTRDGWSAFVSIKIRKPV